MKYYYQNAGKQPTGPFELDDLRRLVREGVLQSTSVIIFEDGKRVYAGQFSELRFEANPVPKPTVPPVLPFASRPAAERIEPRGDLRPIPSASVASAVPSAPGGEKKTDSAADAVGTGSIDFIDACVQIPKIALVNAFPIFCNFLAQLAVCWIPWINLGAWFGVFGLCARLGGSRKLSPTEVLNDRYRNLVTNFCVMFSMMWSNILICLIAAVIPWLLLIFSGPMLLFGNFQENGFVGVLGGFLIGVSAFGSVASFLLTFISIFCGWALTPILICDQRLDAAEAVSISGRAMEGNKFYFALILFLITVTFVVALILIKALCGNFLIPFILATMALCFVTGAIYCSTLGYFYNRRITDAPQAGEDTAQLDR